MIANAPPSAQRSTASRAPLVAGILLGLVLMGGALIIAGWSIWSTPAPAPPAPPMSSQAPTGGVLEGICEASTILEDGNGFLVGDNEAEEQLLRYDRTMKSLGAVDLTERVEDIESVTPTPQGHLVVGSHSRNKKGEHKPARQRILALTSGGLGQADFSACEVCVASEAKAPKEGGISIEGAAWWDSALWLGMRSPLDGEKAMLLKMSGPGPGTLSIEQIVRLDLNGRGVRELRVREGVLWVLAGPVEAGGEHALYRVDRPGAPAKKVEVSVPSGSEGFAWTRSNQLVMVIDGDGKPGRPCKTPATWTLVDLPQD